VLEVARANLSLDQRRMATGALFNLRRSSASCRSRRSSRARGESIYFRERAQTVARELTHGALAPEPGDDRMRATRAEVVRGWHAVAERLEGEGERDLAIRIRQFLDRMPPPITDKQKIARVLQPRVREREELTR
jgi:hypothetical protein